MAESPMAGMRQKEETKPPVDGTGSKPVGPLLIAFMTVYLICTSVLLVYGLIQIWPESSSSAGAASSSSVTLFTWTIALSDEARLFLIVVFASALGGLVHGLRSFYWYVGNRQLVRSWLVMYILLPFVAVSLGLVFYLVLRGGLFTQQATIQQTSPFGFAALAAVIGLFSEQAVLKLKQVAETLLVPPPEGKNPAIEKERKEFKEPPLKEKAEE